MKKILTTLITTIFLLSALASASINVNAQTTDQTALTITGLVDHPTNLTLAQLKTLPKTSEYAAIICVDFPTSIVENGNWTGVQLSTLLGQAGIQAGAVKIKIAANDGYSSDLTIQDAMQSNVILAYEKDGEALNALRLVVPGRWGYKWVNFVSNIEVLNYDYQGFWESRGYSDSAIIGQESGGSGGPQFTPPSITPNTQMPSVTPTPTLSTTPSPTALPDSTIGTEATIPPNNSDVISTEMIYAIVIALVAAVVIATLVVRKKVKK